ncbi:hypothetical protein ACS0TY_019592 [Phlomoides rotata]
MMRVRDKILDSFLKQRNFGTPISRVLAYSTQTQAVYSDTLYGRLQRCNGQRISVIPVIDDWISEGREMHDQELKRFIINCRKNRRFIPALEVAEWMSNCMKNFAITSGHVAVQLDLISKVHGVEQAENFFTSLDERIIDVRIYAALLNCYADGKLLEKAEATLEKIRMLNDYSTLAFNTMLSLYSQMGMHEKLDSLMQEMENKGINFNEVTYNIRLNAYADSDSKGMERLLMKMEVDPMVRVDFYTYVTAAKGYIKAGALDKASTALKKAEHLVKPQDRQLSYGSLMTFYATMQKREEVYRLLNRIRSYGKLNYRSSVYIFTSLEKFDDLDSAKKILEEWEENNTHFDLRIPNLVISAYCKKGRVGEAESILNRLIETAKEPSAKTWSHMALGYYKSGRMGEAVEMTKKAFVSTFPGWKPDITTVAACLEYLKKKGDADGIQEMLMLLEKCGSFSVEFKESIRKYIAMGSQST